LPFYRHPELWVRLVLIDTFIPSSGKVNRPESSVDDQRQLSQFLAGSPDRSTQNGAVVGGLDQGRRIFP
jgi:hypothetical protein